VTTGQRIRKIRAHREIVNSLDRTMGTGSGIELLATGSDDCTVKIWEGGDEAGKQPVATFDVGCPVTSVCWGLDGNSVYIGAIDNEVHVCFTPPHASIMLTLSFYIIGLRPPQERASIYAYRAHRYPNLPYSVAKRKLSAIPSRIHRVLQGAPAGFEQTLLKGAWSKDDGGGRVAVGGADRMVCIWEVETSRLLYKVFIDIFYAINDQVF
jgi:Prp8 binding protein